MTVKEFRCVVHYENEVMERAYPSMAEAIHAMQMSVIDKRKPIFAEVVVVTKERVAYHRSLKETL